MAGPKAVPWCLARPSFSCMASLSPALVASIERCRRRLWTLCYRMTGRTSDADDLYQDTIARALQRGTHHAPPGYAASPHRLLRRSRRQVGNDLVGDAQGKRGDRQRGIDSEGARDHRRVGTGRRRRAAASRVSSRRDAEPVRLLEPEQSAADVSEQSCSLGAKLGDVKQSVGIRFAPEAAADDVEQTARMIDRRPEGSVRLCTSFAVMLAGRQRPTPSAVTARRTGPGQRQRFRSRRAPSGSTWASRSDIRSRTGAHGPDPVLVRSPSPQ
jgi:DNA-directed RNA polymerase specialized sigma24 family protein